METLFDRLKTETMVLKGKQLLDYIENLTEILNKASNIHSFQKNTVFLGQIPMSVRQSIDKYIMNIIHFLSPENNYNVYNKYDELTIDARTGFPVLLEIMKIISDKRKANDVLNELGNDKGKLKKDIIDKIYEFSGENKDYYISNEIRTFKKYLYYENISQQKIPELLNINITAYDKKRDYRIDMYGFDGTKNLFNEYEIDLTEKKVFFKLDLVYEEESKLKTSKNLDDLLKTVFGLGCKEVMNIVGTIKSIGCYSVERNVIGPYYFDGMQKNEDFEKLFDLYGGTHILKLSNYAIKKEEPEKIDEKNIYLVYDSSKRTLLSHCKENDQDIKIKI